MRTPEGTAHKGCSVMSKSGRGDVEFYMGGACPIFAIALHRLTKFPLAMLIDETQPFHPSAFSEASPTIAHVFVVTPDGRALDIRGIHTLEDLKSDYPDLDEPKIENVSLKELRSLMGGHFKPLCRYDAKEIKAAERIAKELLSSHQRTEG